MAAARRLPIPTEDAPHFEGLADLEFKKTTPTLLGDLHAALGGDSEERSAYYTPLPLARQVAAWTLGPLLDAGMPIRVLDPAMGGGHFLIAAAELIAGEDTPEARRKAVESLYGIERDPLAAEVARLSLWLWARQPDIAPESLADQLVCADALLDDLDLPHFDSVVGNPPFASVFARARRDEEHTYRDKLRARFETAAGSFDLAVPFVERALKSVRDGGRVGLVLPNKLVAASYGDRLRNWIGERATVSILADYSAENPFGGADVYPVAVVLEKSLSDTPVQVFREKESKLQSQQTLPQSDLQVTPGNLWSVALSEEWPELRHIWERDVVLLGDMATLSAGMTVGEAYDLRDAVFDAPPNRPLPTGFFMLVTSGLIRRYQSLWGQTTARYLKSVYRRPVIPAHRLPSRRYEQSTGEKIVIAGMGLRPRGLLDRGVMQAAVATVIITEAVWPLGALCAVLNSELMARMYRAMFGGLALSGGYLRFGQRELAALPLPRLESDDPHLTRLAKLADEAMRADSLVRSEVEAEIDGLVYELYG